MVAMMLFNATQQHLIACAKRSTWYQRHRHAHWTHAHWTHTGHVHGPHTHWGAHAHVHTQPHTHCRVWPHGSLVWLMLWWSFRLGHRTSPMSTSVDLDIKQLCLYARGLTYYSYAASSVSIQLHCCAEFTEHAHNDRTMQGQCRLWLTTGCRCTLALPAFDAGLIGGVVLPDELATGAKVLEAARLP